MVCKSISSRGGRLALGVACLLVAPSSAQESEPSELPRVLFLTHSAGFTHSVVRRPEPDALAHAERALVAAARGRMEIVPTQDCGQIRADVLETFDAVLFYTTGELPISEEGRAALMEWIRHGGAFAGSHCATDTLYQYMPYVDLIGGQFNGHPWHQEVGVIVEDPRHPAVAALAPRFTITDEIYQFKEFRRHPLRVLLRLDNDSVEVGRGKRPDGDYALAWCKGYGEGRVFYTALGHREAVWDDARFTDHLLAGLRWAIDKGDDSPPPPKGAAVLFDGKSAEPWQTRGGEACGWSVEGGALVVQPKTGNHLSRDAYGSGLYHVEFLVPATPEENRWQDRGNSGVYIQGRYEVQVLDSHGLELKAGDCGGIYGKHVADANACRPAGEWQTFDIRFTAPQLDDAGQKVANARMTVWHNGVRVHADVEVDGPTTAAMAGDEPGLGPLMLQDHGHPVRYRNLWFLPEGD